MSHNRGEEACNLPVQGNCIKNNFIPAKALESLLAHSGELLVYAVNDERLTVAAIFGNLPACEYSPEDFISGKCGWRDMLYRADGERPVEFVDADSRAGAEVSERKYRIRGRQGEAVWVSSIATPEYNSAGEITHFLLKVREADRRRRRGTENAAGKLSATLQSIGEAVIQVDAAGRIEQLNAAAGKLTGVINCRAQNKPLSSVIRFSRAADFGEALNPLDMAGKTDRMVQFGDVFMQCAGNDKTFRVSCNVSRVSSGAGHVLVVKDLTAIYLMLEEARENEARARKSENTIRGIFDHSVDGLLLADGDGTVREWSRGNEQVAGLSGEEAIGKTIWDISRMLSATGCSPEETESLKASLREVAESAERKIFVRSTVHWRTGERKTLHVTYFPVAMPETTMLGAIVRDITEETQAKTLLTVERDRLKALGDNFPDGTLFRFKMDGDGKLSFDYLSGTWEQTLGVTAEASLEDAWNALANVVPDDLQPLLETVGRSVDTLENINAEIRYAHPLTRKERWYQISSHPHRAGATVYFDGFILDVTVRKNAEQELHIEKSRLEALGNNIPGGCLYSFRFDDA